MKASELARKAALRLATTGWNQGAYGGPSGPNCAVGAIWEESQGKLTPDYQQLLNTIRNSMLPRGAGLADTNDRIDTTAEDMISMLLLAAEILEDDGK